jgi:hypothetical protein
MNNELFNKTKGKKNIHETMNFQLFSSFIYEKRIGDENDKMCVAHLE